MKLKIGFFAIMLILSFLFSPSLLSLCTILAAFLHELGHIGAASLCGIHLRECQIGIYGAGLVPDGNVYSYGQEIFLCLCGPLVNFICASVGIWFLQGESAFWEGFVFSSLALGVLNLLPIQGFDGARILNALLSKICLPRVTERITSVLSFLFVFLLWCCSIYLLLRFAASLSLFIFSLSLFCRIFLSEK
jgi:Zn-dependent protease